MRDTATPPPRSVHDVASAFRRGQIIAVLDSERPARGAILAAPGESTSDDVINFMATHGRGLVCLALLPERLQRLGLYPQAAAGVPLAERFAASIEARTGVTTGISALDRARTIQVASDPSTGPDDLISPGHVFPVAANHAGVLYRPGWAEACLDLTRVAGTPPAATFCRILDDAGEVASTREATKLADAHGLPVVTIEALIAHRMANESFVTQLKQAALPTAHGTFIARAFVNRLTGRQHLAIGLGELRSPEPTLVRLHSECLTGDVFASERCDCGGQLNLALAQIQAAGRGVVLYLRQEGRGIGLANKVRAYSLQDAGRDTVEANVELGLPIDRRDYGVAAQMLGSLGVQQVRLLTNNPEKVSGLTSQGVDVVERVQLEIPPGPHNAHYLRTKKDKLGHLLDAV